tara:strand:+ start:2110 stop:2565 length:456 start_codon:yes stop_codon:yes gene_type:complete
MRISVIEDDPDFQKILELIFLRNNWDYVFFNSGEDFVYNSYDVVIIDYQLPGEKGDVVLYDLATRVPKGTAIAMMSTSPEWVTEEIIDYASCANLLDKGNLKSIEGWIERIDNRIKASDLINETRYSIHTMLKDLKDDNNRNEHLESRSGS